MTFEGQLISLCRLLEQWRADCNTESAADPDDFPDPNWRVAGRSLIFFALGQIAIFEQSRLNYVHGIPTLCLYIMLLAVCSGAFLVLLFHALGVFERQFWRALKLIFKKKSNYPFTPLIRSIETDLAAAKMLSSFSDEIVTVVRERLGVNESELRDRLAIMLGQPSLTVLAGLLAGAWAGWKGLHRGDGTMAILLCALSIILFTLSVFGFRLRVALLELTRCRAMLSLEIARRKMESKDSCVSEPRPSAQRTPTSPVPAPDVPS
jgi:hypothetical protein